MQALRSLLSLPLWILQAILAVVFQSIDAAARWTQRGMQWCIPHVYYPVCRAKRWIAGEPTWKVADYLALRIAPRGPEQEAMLERYAADRDCRVVWDMDHRFPILVGRVQGGDVVPLIFGPGMPPPDLAALSDPPEAA